MKSGNSNPHILLYNPRCAKPGFQRLPLSLLQIGAYLEGLYRYDIVDGNLDQDEDIRARIVDMIRTEGTRYLGITIMPGPQLSQAIKHLRWIKDHCTDLIVIAGGYFPTDHPEVCARDPAIDYVVVGSGEVTLVELIDMLESGCQPDRVAGLAYMRGDDFIRTANRPPVHPNDLPEIPYQKVPVERYICKTFLGARTLSHHSSFGCPFLCNFCAVALVAEGRWMAENAERLGKLAQRFSDQWGIDALEFHDNNFFVSEKRVADFCEELLKRNLKLAWWGEGRVDVLLKFSDRTWDLMRDSGLKMVFLGAESGDDDVLKRMNKGGDQSADSILALVERAKRYDIIPELSFILGNPPDTEADLRNGIRFVRRVKEINPKTEIILYRYDPVPLEGDFFDAVENEGFYFPDNLDAWVDPHWQRVQKREGLGTPWMSKKNQRLMHDFQTIVNARYPSITDRQSGQRLMLRRLVHLLGTWRYRWEFYRWPYEIRALQRLLAYQRPEVSGF